MAAVIINVSVGPTIPILCHNTSQDYIMSLKKTLVCCYLQIDFKPKKIKMKINQMYRSNYVGCFYTSKKELKAYRSNIHVPNKTVQNDSLSCKS